MKVIIGGHDERWNVQIAKMLEQDQAEYEIRTSRSGKDLLEMIRDVHPRLLVLDMMIPEIDGIGIVEELAKDEKMPDVILAVPMAMKSRLYHFHNLKQTWVIEKPVEQAMLISAVHSLMKSEYQKNHANQFINMRMVNGMMKEDLEVYVTNVLHDVGVPAHIKGYRYLRYAIMLAVSDMDILNSITKQLYPEIAREYQTTSDRVERAIRHAIMVAWERGMPEQMQVYFGYAMKLGEGKPTNSEFIAMIADKIRLESKIMSA